MHMALQQPLVLGAKTLPARSGVDHFTREIAGFDVSFPVSKLSCSQNPEIDSHHGLQKHITSQTCIARFGELSESMTKSSSIKSPTAEFSSEFHATAAGLSCQALISELQ